MLRLQKDTPAMYAPRREDDPAISTQYDNITPQTSITTV